MYMYMVRQRRKMLGKKPEVAAAVDVTEEKKTK